MLRQNPKGTLKTGEPHPSAQQALAFLCNLDLPTQMELRRAMASCAIEGNRVAEVCGETLRRVIAKEPVSDRYCLGLAWFIMNIGKEAHENIIKELVNSPQGVVPDSVYRLYPGIKF